jgi:predicted XRE-type DNA-binding protein/phage-related protein
MAERLKPVSWVGSSLHDLKTFPEEAQDDAGHQLFFVQLGLDPLDWKPLSSVGAGVREIRVHTGVEHRIVYVAKFEEQFMSFTRSKSAPARRGRRTSTSRGDATRKSSRTGRRAPAGDKDPIETFATVWDAIRDTPEEAANMRLRSELMIRIDQLIRRRRLTQARAAKLFGVSQPRISDLVRGKIGKFSVDILIEMLHRAGMDVRITVHPEAA